MAARARKHSESLKAYRRNLKKEAQRDKARESGSILWYSANGTYERSKHGELR
jgi:hypothetical protein